MNKNPTENEIISSLESLQKVSLSVPEARAMRERLAAYAQMHPIIPGEKSAVRSPFFLSPLLSPVFLFSPAAFSALVLVLVVLGGTGVSYAAKNTLPGEPLYGVKVSLVEPITGAFITNPAEKGAWENTLADRRLTEAATLASRGTLATSTQKYLAEAVVGHVAESQKESDALDDVGQSTSALEVRSDLDARLSAHAQLLSIISPQGSPSDAAQRNSNAVTALLATVQQQQSVVNTSRQVTEGHIAGPIHTSATPALSASSTPIAIALSTSATSSMMPHYAANPQRNEKVAGAGRIFVAEVNKARVAEQATLFAIGAANLNITIPTSSTTATSTVNVPANPPSTISSTTSSNQATSTTKTK
jgi:hypothetical protein